ncbi:MAG: TolC family outer membrane protein [Chakrabartia sp.]
MRHRLKYSVCVALVALCASGSVSAETLREAMAKAYTTNPTMTAARAGQRANDENVPLNRARGLPGLDVSANVTETLKNGTPSIFNTPRQAGARLNFDVPLYLGGAVKNGIRAADARVDAGQADLRGTEADLFSAVVASYMDVLRDEAIAGLNLKQVQVLNTNLEATRDRFEVGDLTRTDVAQSESRLAVAKSQQETAQAQLISSREKYIQLVGNAPGQLEQPPVLPNLPETSDAAVEKALSNNPDLIAANKAAEAARYDIGVARASRLPKVSGVANGTFSSALGSLDPNAILAGAQNQSTSASAGVQLTLPLFQGGAPSAQVRQAQARSTQALEQVIGAERAVIAQTRSSYAVWRASNAVIVSSETAVAAAGLSLQGVRAENSVGTRSILDILNAEQEYLDAQVRLVSAKRNAYVAGFSLLAAMGQAEARDLGLDGGALYDPEVNYKRVRNRISDWDSDPKPAPVATRTVDTQAQTPALTTP